MGDGPELLWARAAVVEDCDLCGAPRDVFVLFSIHKSSTPSLFLSICESLVHRSHNNVKVNDKITMELNAPWNNIIVFDSFLLLPLSLLLMSKVL